MLSRVRPDMTLAPAGGASFLMCSCHAKKSRQGSFSSTQNMGWPSKISNTLTNYAFPKSTGSRSFPKPVSSCPLPLLDRGFLSGNSWTSLPPRLAYSGIQRLTPLEYSIHFFDTDFCTGGICHTDFGIVAGICIVALGLGLFGLYSKYFQIRLHHIVLARTIPLDQVYVAYLEGKKRMYARDVWQSILRKYGVNPGHYFYSSSWRILFI